jgi:oxazoline/thiazoline synthase
MLTRPRFLPHFHVEVVPGEGVFLLSDSRQTLLRGRLYELVAPWLDGRTAHEVCHGLQGQASPADIYYTLAQLESKNYLYEADAGLPIGHAALWSSQQIAPGAAARALANHPVVVRAFGVDAGPFVELLQSLHVKVADTGPADVVLTDSYVRDELQACNTESLRAGRDWLLVKPLGRQVWVGPLFRPDKTGCWECLAQRLRANFPVASYLHGKSSQAGAVVNDRASTPATVQIASGLAANAVASWIVQGKLTDLEGKLQSFDVPTWRLQTHNLVRLPFCPACGRRCDDPIERYQPPALESCKKAFTSDAGHRMLPPEETLARYGHHVSAITGAVPMLERSGTADGVLHVYVAGNNWARPHGDLSQLRGDLRYMNAGKGTCDVQARASGLCEGLERYSGVFRGNEPRRLARMSELGELAIRLDDCLLFSESQYQERDKRNSVESRFGFIPAAFDPNALIEWSPVWSLTRNQVRYLPTAFCYYDYPQPDEQPFCIACSNGNAAGNTFVEAILQGFLELVERDSVALWWYNRVRRPGVDLASFHEPYLARLQAFLQKHGRKFWVIDLTADLNIPVFASVTRRTEASPEQIVFGFGAHLDPRIALLRAVTEMNQMLASPLLEPASQDVGTCAMDPETARWLQMATVADQSYLLPADGPPRHAASFPSAWTDDMADDVRACQAKVENAGMEMLILDQTRPEIGLPVAKVIVPGLRHFWARFAPGRLYDVPVQLGWLPRALAENELNPISMFL